ncbi:MAG TPA: ribonuclease H-like domain-containing protein [Candidatus Nanoarchaeia archaeon]|nr:ribonuclease H-like domain-containing protein [Candidatus Nanoarchaeia archaeon]
MVLPLSHWKKLYQKLKHQALCIDVEATHWNGPISIIGVYKPKEGEIEYTAYVKDINLTAESLKKAFAGCKLLITFNGMSYDVPEIKKQFLGAIPDNMPVIDLYLLAKSMNMDGGLKILEKTFNIFRKEEVENKRRISTKYWKKYEATGNEKVLETLIEYNRQDTINLYPLAEKIMEMIE